MWVYWSQFVWEGTLSVPCLKALSSYLLYLLIAILWLQGSQLIQMKISAPTETGEESPVTSFVQLERYNAIRLVQIVHASLSSLSKVIRGTALLDADVQALAGALLKQEVNLLQIFKEDTSSNSNNSKYIFQERENIGKPQIAKVKNTACIPE